jgi:hypothetical protein
VDFRNEVVVRAYKADIVNRIKCNKMQLIRELHKPMWTRQDIKNAIPIFAALQEQKPIENIEQGKEKLMIYFAIWFITNKLQPKYVIESSLDVGLQTWFIEQAAPNAELIGICKNVDTLTYKSSKSSYQAKDFAKTTWKNIDTKNTLLIFADNSNAFERVKSAQKAGFKHLLFTHNYPANKGSAYTLKKAFMHAGFRGEVPKIIGRWAKLKAKFSPPKAEIIAPNANDAAYLKNICKVYTEFPPIFKADQTQWGDAWIDFIYPTPLPILEAVNESFEQVFKDLAPHYTWTCYVQL